MSQKHREVIRKANVGERIRIVNPTSALGYGLGDEGIVIESLETGVYASLRGERRGVYHREYVVLDPIETSAELSELFSQFIRENAAPVRKYLDEIECTPDVLVDVVKSPTRAEVIAKAKADVAELTTRMSGPLVQTEGNVIFRERTTYPEFFVNRGKRAVTVLVRKKGNHGEYLDGYLFEKATAKASPDDVFNADIGKAIALRRALGLVVPDEYVNAPQPEEALVGSFVEYEGYRVSVLGEGLVHYYYPSGTCSVRSICARDGVLLDDTDVDYEEVVA